MRKIDEQSEPEIAAAQWRMLRLALTDRLERLIEDRKTVHDPAESVELDKLIQEARLQVSKLVLEESVAQFVEDAERYVIAASTISGDPDEGDEADESY